LPRPVPHIDPPFEIPPEDELPELPPMGHIGAIAGAEPEEKPRQVGLLGEDVRSKKLVAVSLAASLCMCFFGANKSGKSYTLGTMLEMFLQQLGMVNLLDHPVCAIYFHLHRNGGYLPELLSAVFPNVRKDEARVLAHIYETQPQGIKDVVLVTLGDVAKKQAENPHVKVVGLQSALREQGMDVLRILLGLQQGSGSPLYVRKVEAVIRRLIKEPGMVLTWERLIRALLMEKFDKGERRRLLERLAQVKPFINDSQELKALIQPGRLIIVDISDMWEDPEQAVQLCMAAMRILCMGEERLKADACPLLVAIDEAHKFFIHTEMAQQLEYMVRERRHLGLNLLFGSQDPKSIPGEVLALMDLVGVLRHDSPEWNACLAKHIHRFKELKPRHTRDLRSGAMWLWAKDWKVMSEKWDSGLPLQLVMVRPRVTLHGGQTRAPGSM
jgi:hypothetical protein